MAPGPRAAFPGEPHPSAPGAIAVAAGRSSPSDGKAAGTGISLSVAGIPGSLPAATLVNAAGSAQLGGPAPSSTETME